MNEAVAQAANRLLKGIVADDLLTSYVRLLEQGGCPGDQAAELLGGDEPVEALTSAGMAHVQPPGLALVPRLVPVPPELALQTALADLSRRLVVDHERLLDGQRRAVDAHPSSGSLEAGPLDRLVRVLTDPVEIGDTSRALIGAARRDWLTLENYVMERPLDELAAMPPPPSFHGRVRSRSIYQASCVESAVGARIIEINAQAGEEARVLPKVGMKMKVADEAIALLPLTPTGLSGALLIQSSVVVGALREYFELLWERAIPLGAVSARTPLTPVQIEILGMLAQGMTDESIARRAGLGVTTVRRHIGVIRDELGVETRFAAGVAAVRRGWLG
jgi:DNA-binding CsgD family transcriptional regulator